MTDAMKGWASASGMKSEMVLCAKEKPAKARALMIRCMSYVVVRSWELRVSDDPE